MELFPIRVTRDGEEYIFEVLDYVHHIDDRCKFEVYSRGELVASLQPDRQGHLQLCKNSGRLDDELLHLVADEIETYDW
ncbi:MAG: hypothetical protein JST32_10305 [Bacteroidetes bacterium]|nr:hypothetical protein [Bacteroidota bacterium]